ncbi:MAG: hypothetical protein WCD44_03715 [Candidatus Babeliales bacterium]
MHINKKFLLTILLMQPCKFTNGFGISDLNTLLNSFKEKGPTKYILFGGTIMFVSNGIYSFCQKVKSDTLDNERKELENTHEKVKLMSDLYKVGKDNGIEPEGIDTEKIAEKGLANFWKQLDDNQKKQTLMEKFRQKNSITSSSEEETKKLIFPR